VDGRAKLPGEVLPEDQDLQFLAVRRPLIEWALRRAVDETAGIEVRSGVHITGLSVEGGRVHAVRVDGTDLAIDLVVDALGRRTPTARWGHGAVGTSATHEAVDLLESSDCGVVYYSRYYQIRTGSELPDGPWVLGPRGDLGYLGFATFPGDNDTFAVTLAVPTGFPEWRVLKDPGPFEACVATIPALRSWVAPGGVDPITEVLALAGLRNTIRHFEPTGTVGLIPVGDAYCHTDPVLALGLSFALIHARELTAALRDHSEFGDVGSAYAAATTSTLRERYDLATALDEQRHRLWAGEPVDFRRHDGAYALFSIVAAGAVSLIDADVFRVSMRRTGLLDRTSVLDDDTNLQRHIEQLFGQMLETPQPPPGPTRDDMLAAAADSSEW
jgi:2-polyprenyl-6-methoxyphenol hydroxylase-like FAD-dependent oxidoreductase